MSAADRTKRMISRELKELAKTIPLQKISVKAIIEHCDINRGTFYYHFADKQDLINYTYHNDITVPLRKLINSADRAWDQLTLISLKAMYNNRNFYTQALKITGQNDLNSFVHKEVKENWQLISKIYVDSKFNNKQVNLRYMYYVSDYLAAGAVAMMTNWVLAGMKESPEEVAMLLDLASNNGLAKAIDYIAECT
mgnify:CR=1 FL=1